jgi:hypothetical protein
MNVTFVIINYEKYRVVNRLSFPSGETWPTFVESFTVWSSGDAAKRKCSSSNRNASLSFVMYVSEAHERAD